jgi:hypothetical protein
MYLTPTATARSTVEGDIPGKPSSSASHLLAWVESKAVKAVHGVPLYIPWIPCFEHLFLV